jgi:flagellar basal body-associated protein FliL
MSAAAAPTTDTAAQPPRRKGRKLIPIVVCLVCIGAGAAVPMVVNVPQMFGKTKAEPKVKNNPDDLVIVPFGDVVVNLAEERMTRYLRLKLAVLVEVENEKDVTDRLTKLKAAVKSKLIGYLSGKTLKDVSGSVGVNRLQREVLEQFEEVLYPTGHSHIKAVMFEEYVVQ